MNTRRITEYGLETYDGDGLVYSTIRPTNPSVLSKPNVGAGVYALMNVPKGVAEIEMLCLSSQESFEGNKGSLRRRAKKERNPVVRQLLERDQNLLDRIQVQTAATREFLILIRLKNQEKKGMLSYLDHVERSLKKQGFDSRRADEGDIKRILVVYYEQNMTSGKFENFDGARWIVPDD